MRIFNSLVCMSLLAFLSFHTPAYAKSSAVRAKGTDTQRYIVILDDVPLAVHHDRNRGAAVSNVQSTQQTAKAKRVTGGHRLDVNSADSRQYLQFLDDKFESVRGEAQLRLGRQIKPVHRYRNVLNGFATDLSFAEAQDLGNVPGIKAVVVDKLQRPQTDSGPNWLGANQIHEGSAGFAPTGGEGVVIGIIDSGANWDHPSFQDLGEGIPPGNGYWDHVNPYGSQLGLCSKPEVRCNDKLVGVYDYVHDDPETEEIEEHNNGEDNSGHGSHVASIAAGNPVNVTLTAGGVDVPMVIAGVAPNANIITYRVCYIADPDDPNDDACRDSDVLAAIEQAVDDQVDVINYSLGGDADDPWAPGSSSLEFLNARAAGIFVATSAGNDGPNGGTMGSPANAPWITAVGNASHDRVFAGVLENMSGGTAPPAGLVGASITGGTGVLEIVHARDYGNALCGVGEPELRSTCASNTGSTNPFPAGTFNGKIVVCDRGDYGRIEKGKNVMLAGAAGYVLANTEEWGEPVVADEHCLPALHLGETEGDKLRAWLSDGSAHKGSLSGFSQFFHVRELGDSLAATSSRGPNLPPVEDVMKPDVIAPGTDILAAWSDGDNYKIENGTSMASPHVAGSAALIKSIHRDWTPSMITSAMVMTATPELALDFDNSTATPHKRGGGRPQLDQAPNAGLFLAVSENEFRAADPYIGGHPKDLNLPGLVDTVCRNTCNFRRTVTDLAGGATWFTSVEGLVDGVSVSISPSRFALADGESKTLIISVDLVQAERVGTWVYGQVRLTSPGLPDAVLPLAVFADGGGLPAEWEINSDKASGWKKFSLANLSAMPDATFTSGGLVIPTETVEYLPQDPTRDSVYDRSEGTMTVWHTVPADTLWLHAETLRVAYPGLDLDMFVGLDVNGDGRVQESEELCSSTSPNEVELCDLFSPVAGNYWIMVQNYKAVRNPDEVTLKTAVIGKNTQSRLVASGDGIVPMGAQQEIRLSWDNVNALPGTELMGAVGIGTRRETPNNIGIVPVTFTKTGIASPESLVLINGVTRGVTIAGGGTHDRIFVDVPPGTETLTLSASGADAQQSQNLAIELYRVDFDDAFADAPLAIVPDTSGSALASGSGSNGMGPTVIVNGPALVPGRWYAVVKNNRMAAAAVEIKADLTSTGEPIPLEVALWEASSRPDMRQGFDYTTSGAWRGWLWYTYDEDGKPTWYVASALAPDGNVWVADLLRVTNDGTLQQEAPVGHVSITLLAENDSIFSFVLFGESGSDRERPSLGHSCPIVDGSEQSYDGVWSKPAVGMGGASAVVNGTSQGYLHYIYDDRGRPVWLLGTDVTDNLPSLPEIPLWQWSGYCPMCSGDEPTYETVGVFTGNYHNEQEMTWNLDYVLSPPLSGSVDRIDDTVKLTSTVACP